MDSLPKVKDYMARDLIVLAPQENVYDALTKLINQRISGAPVIEDGKLVGVLSERDCLSLIANGSFYDHATGIVRDFMSRIVHQVDPEMDIFEVANRFMHYNYRRFPVVQDGKIIGQISRGDVIRAISKESLKLKTEKQHDSGYLSEEMKGALKD